MIKDLRMYRAGRFDVRKHVDQTLLLAGRPTGYYADRSTYGNSPTLAIVLEHRILCQAFCDELPDRFWNSDGHKFLYRLLDMTNTDWTNVPEMSDEYIPLAAACLDDVIASPTVIKVLGTVRNDGVIDFYCLKTPMYSFNFLPKVPDKPPE